MFLLWRSAGRDSAFEIHILDLSILDQPDAGLAIRQQSGALILEWAAYPGFDYKLYRIRPEEGPELVTQVTGTFGLQAYSRSINEDLLLFQLVSE